MTTTGGGEHVRQEFERAVNMTPSELEAWLRAQDADGPVATEVTERILDILSKPQAELTPEDASIMESVVGRIRLERRDDLRPAGDDAWRQRLMALGHDPSKDPD